MSWDPINCEWKHSTRSVEMNARALTDDELSAVTRNREQLLGLLESYGYEKEQAEVELSNFAHGINDKSIIYDTLLR